MKTMYENYGEDADGNRGVKTLMYELENTEQERKEIAELLYEKFLHRITGEVEIEYEDLTIEVKIEDYLEELVGMVKVDMDLEEECVHNIASELDDFNIIVDWKINKEKVSAEQFVLVGKYALNRLNYDKFKKLLEKGIGHPLNESYVEQKREAFTTNMLSFLVSYKELTEEILKEILKTGYKG